MSSLLIFPAILAAIQTNYTESWTGMDGKYGYIISDGAIYYCWLIGHRRSRLLLLLA
jgi:hypothetical protein